MNDMQATIKEYFEGFFDDVKFYCQNGRGLPYLAFDGLRNGHVYSHTVPHNVCEGDMLFHWLENIKGELLRDEKIIILEK